jgi:hypothetical protein
MALFSRVQAVGGLEDFFHRIYEINFRWLNH